MRAANDILIASELHSGGNDRMTATQIAERRLCMGCGFCRIPLREAVVEVAFDPELGHVAPVKSLASDLAVSGSDFVCPGANMDMQALAKDVHGTLPHDEMLGNHRSLRIGYAGDRDQRRRAASGGIIPALLETLFKSGGIEAAYCVVNGHDPKGARGELITDVAALQQISGSVYHPADFGRGLRSLVDSTARFAFVGLPCEIAALEMLKRHLPRLAERHVLSIGLFCGGINTFRGVGYYLKGFGVDPDEVEKIDYRHGDWPGKIKLTRRDEKEPVIIPRIRGNTRWMILRYVIAFQGYWMLPRCRMCPDQVADFADIAVGDPHLPRLRTSPNDGISVIVARSSRGESLLQDTIGTGAIHAEPISRDEVIESQGYTLDNRRHVEAYRGVAKIFGMQFPDLRVYPILARNIRFRHRVYAFVDLMKVSMPKGELIQKLYFPWQIFEYLFLTFTPSLIVRRIRGLVGNQRNADDV